MTKVPVLVTGGAGYIGSHAVLALRDAGWPVAVIDDLSTGARQVVPEDVPFYEGSIADRALVERIFAEQGIQAIMHFAGSIVVPELVEKPLDYYAQQHACQPRADQRRGRCRSEAHPLFVDRGGLRRARAGAGRGGRPQAADQPLRRVEADDRADARRRRRPPIRSTMARCAISMSPAPTRKAGPARSARGRPI